MPGGDRGTPISQFAYLDRAARSLEDLLSQRQSGIPCGLCGRRADRFRIGPGHTVLCVECAPDGGEWYTVDRVFAGFLCSLTLLRNVNVTLLGLRVLESLAPPDVGAGGAGATPLSAPCGELDRLTDDCLYLFGLVKRLRGIASACGYPVPAEDFFPSRLADPGPLV